MKRYKRWLIGRMALIGLLGVWLTVTLLRSNPSTFSFPLPVTFAGEYSRDGGPWQTLTEKTKFNALDGDLVLRGHLDADNPHTILYFCLDHIRMKIFADGEQGIE